MIKIRGTFNKFEHEGHVGSYLTIDLPDIYYQQLKSHIIYSMFLSVKQIADKYQKILIKSVGDHLDKNGDQNLLKADICIHITLSPIDPSIASINNNDPLWNIYVINKQSRDTKLAICIDKANDMIIHRKEITAQ